MIGRRGFVASVSVAAGTAAVVSWSSVKSLGPGIAPAELEGHSIEEIAVHLGAVVFRMRTPAGTTYQVDVLRKGDTAGLRDTDRYSLFLANRGDGRKATEEAEGLGLIALADWLQSADPQLPVAEMLTFEERHTAHPNGLFLLT